MAVQRLVDVDRISAEAQQIQIGRTLLTLFIGFFWLVGFIAGRAVLGLKTAVAAMKVGWRAGMTPNPRRGVGPA
jgi:hypothetical protein